MSARVVLTWSRIQAPSPSTPRVTSGHKSQDTEAGQVPAPGDVPGEEGVGVGGKRREVPVPGADRDPVGRPHRHRPPERVHPRRRLGLAHQRQAQVEVRGDRRADVRGGDHLGLHPGRVVVVVGEGEAALVAEAEGVVGPEPLGEVGAGGPLAGGRSQGHDVRQGPGVEAHLGGPRRGRPPRLHPVEQREPRGVPGHEAPGGEGQAAGGPAGHRGLPHEELERGVGAVAGVAGAVGPPGHRGVGGGGEPVPDGDPRKRDLHRLPVVAGGGGRQPHPALVLDVHGEGHPREVPGAKGPPEGHPGDAQPREVPGHRPGHRRRGLAQRLPLGPGRPPPEHRQISGPGPAHGAGGVVLGHVLDPAPSHPMAVADQRHPPPVDQAVGAPLVEERPVLGGVGDPAPSGMSRVPRHHQPEDHAEAQRPHRCHL